MEGGKKEGGPEGYKGEIEYVAKQNMKDDIDILPGSQLAPW